MKKVLIMGANGYIGSCLTKYLCDMQDKYEVIASGRHNNYIDSRAKYIEYDIIQEFQNPQEFMDLFGIPDICIYLAWQDGFAHNSDAHMNDLPYHWNFIKQMLDSGIRHLAVAGSFREYGAFCGAAKENSVIEPDNYYTLAKDTLHKAIEIYIHNSKEKICFQWLRPFSVYGYDKNNHSVFSKMLQWESEGRTTFPCTDGTERYDYIHIDELVRQIEAIVAQTKVDGVINCCTGHSTSLKEQIEEFICENHLKIRPVYGGFPKRSYDSDEIYGDRTKLNEILGESNGKN